MQHDQDRVPAVQERFGYLLKHARERLSALSTQALYGLDISGRELAVLTVLADGRPPSQLEAARRLGVDRTTMVLLVDALEAKGFVRREADPSDRRRNIVVLTAAGRDTLSSGSAATDAAERAFLGELSPTDGERLRQLLQATLGIGSTGRPRA